MPPKRKTNLKQKQKQNQRQTVVVHVHTTKPAARRRRAAGKSQQPRGSNFITVQPSLAVTTNPIPQMYSPQPQQNSLEQLGIKTPVDIITSRLPSVASSPSQSVSYRDAFLPIHPYVEPVRPLAIHPLHGTTIDNINNTLTSALKGHNLTLTPIIAQQDDDDEEVAGFSRSSSPHNVFDLPVDNDADIEDHVERPVTVTQNVPVQEVLTQENPAKNTTGFTELLQQWKARTSKTSVETAPVETASEGNFEKPVKKIRKPRKDKGIARGAYKPRKPSSTVIDYDGDNDD